MRSDRRMAFTFGNSTFVTRMPGTFRPPACAAACCRLAINSFPNLLMLSSSFAFALEQLGELADAALFAPASSLHAEPWYRPSAGKAGDPGRDRNRSPVRRHACRYLAEPTLASVRRPSRESHLPL